VYKNNPSAASCNLIKHYLIVIVLADIFLKDVGLKWRFIFHLT